MRWPLCPGSAFPLWLCFSLKSEDTANSTTMSPIRPLVSWRSSRKCFKFSKTHQVFVGDMISLFSGWPGLFLSMISFLFFTDMCIYWIHRFLHHKLIYKVRTLVCFYTGNIQLLNSGNVFIVRHCSLVPNSCFTNHTTYGRSPLPLPVTLFIQWTASCKECPTTSTRSSSPSTRCSTWLFTFSLTSGPSPSTTATIVSPELWRASSTAQLTTLTTTSSSTSTTVNISLCGTAWEAPTGTRQLWWGKVPMIWSGNFKQRESWEMTRQSLTGKWMDGLRGELPVRRSNSTWVMSNFRKWSLFL